MNKLVNNKNLNYMDFSQLSLYKKCPLSYKWKYIDRKVPKEIPNYYYAFQGMVIQKLFELFYNESWYLKKDKCREYIFSRAPDIFAEVLKYCTIDWHDRIAKKTKQQVYEAYLEMIPIALATIKEHKLLGAYAKSEEKLQAFMDDKYTVLTAKMDFLIKNQNGINILDGKNTSNKSTYTKDPTQLYFYALVFYLRYNVWPDKLAYWFWRDGKVVYIDLDKDKVEALKVEIKDVLYKIFKKKFEPNPEYKSCLFCNYKEDCLYRTKKIAENKAAKNAVADADLEAFL